MVHLFINRVHLFNIDPNLIFAHYESYIRKLSLRPYTDEFGMTQFFVDYELKNRLETKLLEKILDFEAV